MFKKVFSITIIAMLLFNVNTFADTNILSNQQQKVSKVMFERDLKKIIETKKEIIEAAKKEQKKSLGKILIYHTHTLEEYSDGTTVIDAGNDLAEKLNNLGFEVDNVVDNFSVDYNNAYASSRNYLSNIDLTQYKLVIDLHRDAAGSKIIRQLEDGDCTVVKFVFSTSNKNYTEQQNLANKISANLQDIYDEDFTYDKGILHFNQDLSNNIVLIENGFIKEFQRLKADEQKQIGWTVKRELAKINYRIHTDAIKDNIIIPLEITKEQASFVYASEADVLNVALFGMTAKQWREQNPDKKGNMRDYAEVSQLVCLSNLENLNAYLIDNGVSQQERLIELNKAAIRQMKVLVEDTLKLTDGSDEQ